MKYYVQSGPITPDAKKVVEEIRELENVVGVNCVIDAPDPYSACLRAAIHCESIYDTPQDDSGVYDFAEGADFKEYSILYGPFFLVSEIGFVYPPRILLNNPQLREGQYKVLHFPDITSTLSDEIDAENE